MAVRYDAGRRRLVPVLSVPQRSNDSGAYRVYSVPPGRYIVSASASDVGAADLPDYVRTFYPGISRVTGARRCIVDDARRRTTDGDAARPLSDAPADGAPARQVPTYAQRTRQRTNLMVAF